MLSSMNTIANIETLYALLGERDYEAVMSYLADDIVWIVADNSPLADRSPYHGIAEVHPGVFERLTAGFGKNRFFAGGNFWWDGGGGGGGLRGFFFMVLWGGEGRQTKNTHPSGG